MDARLGRIVDEAHAKQLPALVDEWSATPHTETYWLARAIRLDLALLTSRPELALPCLVRRFAWIGRPQERAFFAKRPPVDEALRETARLVETWQPDRLVLRALRPPRLPIDSGVVEEYRTSAKGPLALYDEDVGIAYAVLWDRGTGRRVQDVLVERPAPPRVWELDYDGDRWGKITLVEAASGGRTEDARGRRVVIRHDGSEIVRGVRPLCDGLVLVGGDDLDMDDFYAVIDPEAGAILWRHRGACSSVAIDGDRLAMIVDDTFVLRRARDGELLASWYCGEGSDVAIAPSGAIATRAGSVIRVWDPAVAREWGTFAPVSSSSYIDAQFSPDGDRVLTGNLLCNTRDGSVVARLPMSGPGGWLEGGPPDDCQAFVRGAVVEILPFGFTRWDPASGAEREDDTRRAYGGDVVAFDREGRYHAIYKREGALFVYELQSGRRVFERAWTLARPQLGFATSGAILLVQSGAERFAIDLDSGVVTPASEDLAWQSPAPTIDVVDGVLEYRGAAIPCDDPRVAVSPDGTQLAWRGSHYALT